MEADEAMPGIDPAEGDEDGTYDASGVLALSEVCAPFRWCESARVRRGFGIGNYLLLCFCESFEI